MSVGGTGGPDRTGYYRLLARLDRDPGRAAREFGGLRRGLERFFDWRGSPFPEDCADETLSRLVAKLEEGLTVVDMTAFAHGIARLVLLERSREGSRVTGLDSIGSLVATRPDGSSREELNSALDACLERLEPEERALVLAYYAGGEGRAKIEHRRRLAREGGLSENALRSRVQRLRDRLEVCLRTRSGAGTEPAESRG